LEHGTVLHPALNELPVDPPAPVVPDVPTLDAPPEIDASIASDQMGTGEFRDLLLGKCVVAAQQLAIAQSVVRQSRGGTLIDALVSEGADEVAMLRALGECSGLEFETVDHARGADAFDHELLQRLTPEYCKANRVLPLRVENERVVLGTSRPDDVFML